MRKKGSLKTVIDHDNISLGLVSQYCPSTGIVIYTRASSSHDDCLIWHDIVTTSSGQSIRCNFAPCRFAPKQSFDDIESNWLCAPNRRIPTYPTLLETLATP